MNQLSTSTNGVKVNPSPMFGSVWVALYCRLRDYKANEATPVESGSELKKTGQTRPR